ncbi:MAG: MMPL family transporter [Deltaproteobacteria bacterium]|nr:MMPL family transporter [Deltaproteobacteria bacterium]
MRNTIKKAAGFSAQNAWLVLSMALALTLFSLWGISKLPVYTARKALMPQKIPVAQRLQKFIDKFGSASDLIVVLENAPRAEMESFASDLANELRLQPEISQASERLNPDFFLKNAFLMIPPDQMKQLSGLLDLIKKKKKPPEWPGLNKALDSAAKWLRNPPPLSKSGLNIKTAEESLGLSVFFFEEWQRFLESDHPIPSKVDWSRLLVKQGAEGLTKSYFTSNDNKMLFVFVHARNSSEEFSSLQPFIHRVDLVSRGLIDKYKARGRTPPTLAYTGLPAIIYEEYTAIQRDIKLVIITAAVFVLLLILFSMRSIKWALVIFIPMGLGVVWSSGLAFLVIGHLTIVTSGFTAILFGLGVDYGIFASSRIMEERRKGAALVEAIATGMAASYKAILTAGGASVLIFGALSTVEFPGFSELGIVAGLGVLLVLVATLFVQPALYALLPPSIPKLNRHAPQGRGTANEMSGRPFNLSRVTAAALLLLAVVLAGFGIYKGISVPFDYDVMELLPKNSEAAKYQKRMVHESDFQGEVIVFTASTIEEGRRISEEAVQLKSIARVQSMASFFPPDADDRVQKAKTAAQMVAASSTANKFRNLKDVSLSLKEFNKLRALVKKGPELIDRFQEQAFSAGHSTLIKNLERLREQLTLIIKRMEADPTLAQQRSREFFQALLVEGQKGLNIISSWQEAKALTPQDLPSDLRSRFFAADGTMAIYAFPKKSVYATQNLDELIDEVYKVSPAATGFPTTHKVFSRMVVSSFFRGTQLAVTVALFWILIIVRSWRGFLIAVLPLMIGGGWMVGLMAFFGIKYNYANIIALPLAMGLGVDYGVWFAHRRFELIDLSPWQVAAISGKPILLAAGTTFAGLGAITLAEYRGVSSMGIAITIGLACCLSAALLMAPVITQLVYRRKS